MVKGKEMVNLEKLRSELSSVPDDYIILIETTADKASELSLAAMKILTDKNDNGFVISANRPYSNLMTNYERNDIDTKKVFVLDLISKNQNADVKAQNVMFMNNASSLTEISLSVNNYIKKVNGKTFVFFDSITTMLIHNEPYVFARFIHSILTRMRVNGVGGLLISLTDQTNKEVRAEIAQLCDKVIKI